MNTNRLVQFNPGSPWEIRSQDASSTTWHHPCGDVASFHFFDMPPDLVAAPNQKGMTALRQMYRVALANHGGIVSVESVNISSVMSVAAIFKLPQKPTGMTYVASLTIPLRDFSFVVKFQCPEIGITGLRDAAIFSKLSSDLIVGENGIPKGWMKDPYLAACDSTAKYNLADQAQYDVDFPDHPLSRARRYLNELNSCVHADKSLADAPQFGAARKPRWKFW